MISNRCDQSHYMSGLIIFIVVIAIASGDNSVHLFNKKSQQSFTSSTLNWLQASHYVESKTIVLGGYRKIEDPKNPSAVKKERQMFVCRASHMGVWVAGTQLEGEKICTVTMLGSVNSYERYELLENVENAARLSWLTWNKYEEMPTGAVYTDKMFVARYVSNDENTDETSSSSTQYIGSVESSDLGAITYVKDDGTEDMASKGEILVETEPIFYELKSIKFTSLRMRIHENERRIIGEATISNTANEPTKLAEAFGYVYNYSSYWGQAHAMIKALNTSISIDNGTTLYNIAWGMREEMERTDVYNVEIHLQPGTAVNVTLAANYTRFEVPYMGQLVSHYEDGETKTRAISAIHHKSTLTDLKTEFGPIYFLSNLSIVPTTLAPPTTLGTTGTTGTTGGSTFKSATASSSSTSVITSAAAPVSDVTNNDEDENMIVPPRKTDMLNIQNDDGGPLSLKNKEDSDHNSSNAFQLSITILLTAVSVNLYQIT